MYTLRITPKLEGPLLTPGEGERILFERIEAAFWEAVLLLETEVKSRTPVGVFGENGGLRGSIFGEVTGQSLLELTGVVSAAAPYAEPVELGARPHTPPIAPLVRWAEVKLGLAGKEAVSAAYRVRAAIAKRGTRGQFMFASSLAESEPKLVEIFERAGLDVAVRWNG